MYDGACGIRVSMVPAEDFKIVTVRLKWTEQLNILERGSLSRK